MLDFFDINASIGRWKHPPLGAYETADELEDLLDYLQVQRAVVYHAYAQEGPPADGNAMLMEALAGRDRLLPCWVVMPHFMPNSRATLVAPILPLPLRVISIRATAAAMSLPKGIAPIK